MTTESDLRLLYRDLEQAAPSRADLALTQRRRSARQVAGWGVPLVAVGCAGVAIVATLALAGSNRHAAPDGIGAYSGSSAAPMPAAPRSVQIAQCAPPTVTATSRGTSARLTQSEQGRLAVKVGDDIVLSAGKQTCGNPVRFYAVPAGHTGGVVNIGFRTFRATRPGSFVVGATIAPLDTLAGVSYVGFSVGLEVDASQ